MWFESFLFIIYCLAYTLHSLYLFIVFKPVCRTSLGRMGNNFLLNKNRCFYPNWKRITENTEIYTVYPPFNQKVYYLQSEESYWGGRTRKCAACLGLTFSNEPVWVSIRLPIPSLPQPRGVCERETGGDEAPLSTLQAHSYKIVCVE